MLVPLLWGRWDMVGTLLVVIMLGEGCDVAGAAEDGGEDEVENCGGPVGPTVSLGVGGSAPATKDAP